MFGRMDDKVLARMRYLEAIDARDRVDGTPHAQRLRQVVPETGRYLALMAACAPEGRLLEIGTSAGYSALWISLACRAMGRSLTTIEVDAAKARLAAETFHDAGVGDLVDLVIGDAVTLIARYAPIAFCFLDAAKDIYLECYESIVPAMTAGGVLIADNVESHKSELAGFLDRAGSDPRVDGLVVPLGRGLMLCRKV